MIEADPDAPMDIQALLRVLPHRYPFLLLDRVEERRGTRSARGIKNLSANEEFFTGHLPGRPELPASLLIECMAQVGAAAVLGSPEWAGRTIYLVAVDRCRFGRPAVPGDRLEIEVELLSFKGSMGKMRALCRVGQEEIGRGELMFALAEGTGAEGSGHP